jgi:release factor glutamine methyltransferase
MTPGTSITTCLQQAIQQLAGVDNPRLEAEILLAHALQQSRTWLHARPEQHVTDTQWQQFHAMLARRIAGEPIAYVTGKRDFWDMELAVSKHTLIPRPETERLVELALERIPRDAAWQIADLGTGSGAIALAIARERPQCHLTATDLSAKALAVARDNAERLGVRNIRFRNSHWFETLGEMHFAMIVSNPPYIHPQDPHLQRGDLRFEPADALRSAADGLEDIRHIAAQARSHLAPPGWLLLEHGYDQGQAVKMLFTELGYQQVSVFQDLGENDRVTLGKWESGN